MGSSRTNLHGIRSSVKVTSPSMFTRNKSSTDKNECKYCNSNSHDSNFHKFFTHANERHRNPERIGCTVVATAPTEISRLIIDDIPVELVGDKLPHRLYIDLYTLPLQCLVDVIDVMSRCYCIWHLPSRRTMSSADRYAGYSLIATKLREHNIEVLLDVVQNIVVQLCEYFIEQNSTGTDTDDVIFKKLMFLVDYSNNEKNPNTLFIMKNCPFCGQHFTRNSSQWTHLKAEHLPKDFKIKLKELENAEQKSSTVPEPMAISLPEATPVSVPFVPDELPCCSHSQTNCTGTNLNSTNSSTNQEMTIIGKILNMENNVVVLKEASFSVCDLSSVNASAETLVLESRPSAHSTDPNAFSCSECNVKIKRQRMFRNHMKAFHPPTVCKVCTTDLKNPDILINHIFNNHVASKSCPICGEDRSNWKTKSHLAMHFLNHRCPICNSVIIDRKNFRRHKEACLARSRFKCPHCEEVFSGKLPLRRHSISYHNDPAAFKCNQCNGRFRFFSLYQRHISQHSLL